MASSDRSVRNLARLQTNASTARVLNLLMTYRKHSEEREYRAKPFFQNALLNRALIVKHRLRSNEYDMFEEPRMGATKIMIPIDHTDLKIGARYIFVGQIGFSDLIENTFGCSAEFMSADIRMLKVLDELPSLDPFLLREQLRRNGVEPARCYFDVSDADISRMFTFVQKEIMPLINMTFGSDATMSVYATRLVNKILSSEIDADLEPLRDVLQLDAQQFEEGVFCWKAFLYYKWQLSELMPVLREVLQEIATVKPRTLGDSELRSYIESGRTQVRRRVVMACERVRQTLEIYDTAYFELTNAGKSKGFREFLLTAPSLFRQLGERLAGIDHVVSFWRYRFPPRKIAMVTAEDLCDIFADFESGLAFNDEFDEAA